MAKKADGADWHDGRKGRRAVRAGEHGRVIGGRVYKRFENEQVFATDGRWLLVLVPEWCRDGWSSFKLFYDYKPARKRVWHLAVKNGRITGGVFITHLESNHPDALKWAKQQLKEYD